MFQRGLSILRYKSSFSKKFLILSFQSGLVFIFLQYDALKPFMTLTFLSHLPAYEH